MLLNSSKSLGPGSAIGKFEFVDVGKQDVESSFLKNSKYNCYRYVVIFEKYLVKKKIKKMLNLTNNYS